MNIILCTNALMSAPRRCDMFCCIMGVVVFLVTRQTDTDTDAFEGNCDKGFTEFHFRHSEEAVVPVPHLCAIPLCLYRYVELCTIVLYVYV